ncbi:MAG: hypothetical protein OHK0024_24210 [Thalassobaculales bacterium]
MSPRPCPVPGCGAPIRRGHLMCHGCWHNVPRGAQGAVNAAWRRVGGSIGQERIAALRAWRAAADAAVLLAEARR